MSNNIPGWYISDKEIKKTFTFKDFAGALEFVNKVGAVAQSVDHHPNISLHGWNKVTLFLSTHSEGRVTFKDHKLAEAIEQMNMERKLVT